MSIIYVYKKQITSQILTLFVFVYLDYKPFFVRLWHISLILKSDGGELDDLSSTGGSPDLGRRTSTPIETAVAASLNGELEIVIVVPLQFASQPPCPICGFNFLVGELGGLGLLYIYYIGGCIPIFVLAAKETVHFRPQTPSGWNEDSDSDLESENQPRRPLPKRMRHFVFGFPTGELTNLQQVGFI